LSTRRSKDLTTPAAKSRPAIAQIALHPQRQQQGGTPVPYYAGSAWQKYARKYRNVPAERSLVQKSILGGEFNVAQTELSSTAAGKAETEG
jgi:hypothetical protein